MKIVKELFPIAVVLLILLIDKEMTAAQALTIYILVRLDKKYNQ